MSRKTTDSPETDHLRLASAARRAGVTVQTFQYYIMVGLIEPDAVSPGKQRLFDDKTIRKVRMINLLNRSGYTLRDIREIFINPRRRKKS